MKSFALIIVSLIFYTKQQQSESSFRLPICSLSEFTIKDLYSPMTIGYQLIKRGFCIVYENGPLDDQITEETTTVDEAQVNFVSDTWKKTIPSLSAYVSNNYKPYDPISINNKNYTIPIVLPNGLCLNKMMPIRYLENKVVTCSYAFTSAIYDALFTLYPAPNCFKVTSNSNYDPLACPPSFSDINLIKRIELIFTINSITTELIPTINFYLKVEPSAIVSPIILGMTYDIKFNITDFPRAGNPGYLPSYPLISGTVNISRSIIEKYVPQLIFSGIDDKGNCLNLDSKTIILLNNHYFDSNLDNRLTFEKSILYGCSLSFISPSIQVNLSLLFNGILENTLTHMSRFGNGQPNYLADWLNINNPFFELITYSCSINKCDMPLITLNFLYADVGAINNTQSTLLAIEYKTEKFSSYATQIVATPPKSFGRIYIKVNYLKYPLNTIKWYAPGPGFILLPRNMMYPFRIGSTTFAERPIIN